MSCSFGAKKSTCVEPCLSLPRRSLLSVLVASCFSVPALGQSAEPGTQEPPKAQVEPVDRAKPGAQQVDTVTVTGTRRREPVRDIPLSVSRLDADELKASGAERLTDYLQAVPGVFVDGAGRGLQEMSIRGITLGANVNPPTSTYLDDVPFGGSTQFAAKLSLDMSQLDLNHIEIYRGPQGTLYGANALGGVLKYVFNEPDTRELGGEAAFGVSSTSHGGTNWRTSAVVNVPLKEGVAAIRVAALHDRDAGHTDTYGGIDERRVDAGNTNGVRVSGIVTPSRDVTLRLSAMQQHLKRDGSDYSDFTLAGAPVQGERAHQLYVPEPFEQRVNVYTADLEFGLPFARMNIVGSHQTSRNEYTTDVSFLLDPSTFKIWVPTKVETTRSTLEARLTSPRSKPIEWIAGIFLNEERNQTLQTENMQASAGGAVSELARVEIPNTYKEGALFGDLTYYPTPGWALTFGARFSHNRQAYDETITGAGTTASRSSDSSQTYLATARYSLSPKSNVYVRLATGYNPGGGNAPILDGAGGATPADSPTYKSNKLLSSEIGYKADLLDGILSIETAAYQLDWKDIQLLKPAGVSNEVVNGGTAKVDGVEFSATYRPTQQWSVTPNLSFNHGRLTQDVPELDARSGDRLPITPKVAASLAVMYSFQAWNSPARLGMNYRYVGERNSGFVSSTTAPNYVLPSYSTINLSAGIELNKVNLDFYVRNVANKAGQRAATSYAALGGPVQVSLEEPRTVGVSARVAF